MIVCILNGLSAVIQTSPRKSTLKSFSGTTEKRQSERRSWRGLHHGCSEIGRRQLWSSLRSDTTPHWTKTSLQTSGHPDRDGDLDFLGVLVDLVDLIHLFCWEFR